MQEKNSSAWIWIVIFISAVVSGPVIYKKFFYVEKRLGSRYTAATLKQIGTAQEMLERFV